MRPINMDGLEEVQICHKLNPIKSFGSKSPKTNTPLGAQHVVVNIVMTTISYLNEGAFSKVQQ